MIPVKIGSVAATNDGEMIVAELEVGNGTGSSKTAPQTAKDDSANKPIMGRGYAYRETNWRIGRMAERSNVQVKKFVPGDRWTAWQRSKARIAKNIEQKKLRNAGKKATKAKKRK